MNRKILVFGMRLNPKEKKLIFSWLNTMKNWYIAYNIHIDMNCSRLIHVWTEQLIEVIEYGIGNCN